VKSFRLTLTAGFLAALVACTPNSGEILAPNAHVSARIPEDGGDGYMTLDAYLALTGGSIPILIAAAPPTSGFRTTSGTSHFFAQGTVQLGFVNAAEAKLEMNLRNFNGAIVNDGLGSGALRISQPLPIRPRNVPMSGTLAAANGCGLIGKASLIGYGSITLVLNTGVTTLLTENLNASATDVQLPECPPATRRDEDVLVACNGVYVFDATFCDPNAGDGGFGSGGSGGGGNRTCELWRIVTEVSNDGGITWEFESSRYEVRNC
jgi:hypothetical protein